MATMEKSKPKEKKKKTRLRIEGEQSVVIESGEDIIHEEAREIENEIREVESEATTSKSQASTPKDETSTSRNQASTSISEASTSRSEASSSRSEASTSKSKDQSVNLTVQENESAKIEYPIQRLKIPIALDSDLSVATEIKVDIIKEKCSVTLLEKADQSCREVSEAASKIVQPLPFVDNSSVRTDKTKTNKKTVSFSKSSAKTYSELSSVIGQMKQLEMPCSSRSRQSEVVPFTFEEIESLFGVKELTAARQYGSQFESNEIQAPAATHPLYEALTAYQRARSQQICNQKEVATLSAECANRQNTIWTVKSCVNKSGGRCADGCYLNSSYSYEDATLQKSLFTNFQRGLALLREKATEIHSLHSHAEHLHKIQVDEIVWMSTVNGSESTKESLRIIFWVLRTSGWGYDRELRRQLRTWCCSLATVLLKRDNSLENLLFLLHHILRVTQGIQWAFHLIKCFVNSVNDISKALSLFEVIVSRPVISQGKEEEKNDKPAPPPKQEDCVGEVSVASEADENMWLVVDSDGEGADLEAGDARCAGVLRENDILGLIKQIPFESIFKELMVIRSDGRESIFCGGNLNGGPVLKVFAAMRVLLSIIRTGLLSHKEYQELTKELCRLALHSIKYCTDLWEVANCNCESNLVERLAAEYNSVVLAGWSTLECAGSKDVAMMFLSEMPFGLIRIETIHQLYNRIGENIIVSDSVWCYYTLVCISNMGITRSEENFAMTVIKKLYEIGFASDFSELGCGEWARTLCGTTLRSKPHLTGVLLLGAPPLASPQWLDALPLFLWKPPCNELLALLEQWKMTAPHLIPFLLKGMDWTQKGGLDLQTHRSVGIFLATMAQNIILPKNQFPEWVWECIFPLKLHCYDWSIDRSWAIQAESIPELDLTGKCHASSVVAVLATSLGHSVPQIILQAAPMLVKLASAGRFAEVVHILHYILPVLADCPEAIGQSKYFKELLSIMIRNEKSYTKMATSLVIGNYAGPVIKLLVSMMQAQLKHFKMFSMHHLRPLLMVWVHWLTSMEGWQGDWVIIHLLDTALGCCFLHHDAINAAASYFGTFIQSPTAARSPTSGSGFSWLWNINSSFKGLVQCSVEAPYMWHATMWTEHSVVERSSGLWQRLVEKLSQHKEGTKVNIDKALKSVGGSDNSGTLVIYRCLQYAISVSLTHPIYSLIWQLFFYLYLDISFLNTQTPKLVGPLFFEGLVNSRLLARAKARLLEAENYHKAKSIDLCDDPNGFRSRSNERQWYHECQTQLMKAYHSWLDDDMYKDLSDSRRLSRPFSDKFTSLMSGNNSAWIEAIDYFELNSFQPPVWPVAVLQGSRIGHQVSYSNIRGKTPEASSSERILLRLRTYEKPLLESAEYGKKSRIEPLLDPRLTGDFTTVHRLMNDHLKFLEKCAQKYDNTLRNLSSIDGNLCDLIPTMYEKREFCKKVQKSCGERCLGKVDILLKGEESKFIDSVSVQIGYNRNTHKAALEKAMKPYDDVATHTATITKLAQLAYDGHIENLGDRGMVLFNTVLNAIKEENTQFPPANQVLVNVATQLGEKFVTNSGVHCVQLVGKVRGAESIGLIGTLLRPSQLPTSEMIRVYSAISTQVRDTHVAFSYLSKFDISGWLHDVRPTVAERSRFISLLCEGLGASGCEPDPERLIVHELMCIHLSKVLAWEFPVHLGQVLTTLCALSLEKKLPPDTWQHCINIIETYPHLLSHLQACESMELVGRQWWSKRGAWGPHGLYSRFDIYGPQMARLGALLASTVLSTAMLHNPPLITKQICSIVMSAMRTFWDVWLNPWWGGAAQVPPWVDDLSRGACLMPWGPDDTVAPEKMAEALVETLMYCSRTLPGSLNDFLSLTWQWYANYFPHPSVSGHVLNRIHRVLAKLPWSAYPEHWLSFSDLQTVAKVTNLNLASCNLFIQQCLGNKLWLPWLESQPPPFHTQAVHIILPLLFKLRFDQQVLEDALELPWNHLSVSAFEETVVWFMATANSTSKIFHSSRLVPLLCAAGGLTSGSELSADWRNKRTSLIRAWVGAAAATNCPAVAECIRDLLSRIQETIMSLENVTDEEKLAEGSALLSSAILMHNMAVLSQVAQEEWIRWIDQTSKVCVTSLISCLLQITQRDAFANISEQALLVFFELEGEWNLVVKTWKNNCIIPVDYLIGNSKLLTALATYKSTERHRIQGNAIDQLDKGILQSLHVFEPECSSEKQSSLWVCYMISLMSDNSLDRANTLAVINQIVAILDKWSLEPSWGLLKAMRLVQNKAPTPKFRIITRFALCLTFSYQQRIKGSSPSHVSPERNSYLRSEAMLEALSDQKPYADSKHIILKYFDFLRNRNNSIQDSLKGMLELCSELYTDVNYLLNTSELFKL